MQLNGLAPGLGCRKPARVPAPVSQPSRCHVCARASLGDWLQSKGVLDANTPVEVTTDGLVATKSITKGNRLLLVPSDAWLSPAVVAESPLGPHVTGLEPWLGLALFLISDRASGASHLAPYTASLPDMLRSPVFWSDAQLELLQGTQLLDTTLNYKDFFTTRFQQLEQDVFQPNRSVFPEDVFTYDAFVWAVGTIRGRVHPPLEGEAVALVPGADLVAHERKGRAVWKKKGGFLGGGGSLALEASGSIQAGELVTMDFGPDKLDARVLLDHGVLDPSSSTTAGFQLALTLPEDDPLFDDKADTLELFELETTMTFDLKPATAPEPELLGLLRLINLQGADAFLMESIFRNEAWGHMMDPVSEENEASVCNAMISGCRAALEGYPSSIADDLALLRSGTLQAGSNESLAVRARMGEKEGLDAALQWFEDRLGKLEELEYYADRRLRRLGLLDEQGKSTYDSYFNESIA